jgi:hypothetical protein
MHRSVGCAVVATVVAGIASVVAIARVISIVVVAISSVVAIGSRWLVVISLVAVAKSVAIIDQVDVTEIPVVVGVAVLQGVLASGGARLHVGVSVRADDEGAGVVQVEAIVAALACNSIASAFKPLESSCTCSMELYLSIVRGRHRNLRGWERKMEHCGS